MVRKQKLLGCIDKVCTLHQKDTLVSMETYVSSQVDSGCQIKTNLVSFLFRVKRVAQLALEELNFISQFNFSLVLLDIVALNKKLGESALPDKLFLQSYVSKPFASTPCLGDPVFLFFILFFILLMICFSFMSSHGTSNLFPRSRSEFQVRPMADECF